MFVVSVILGTAAQRAGVQAGDVILQFGDKEIGSVADLQSITANIKGGDTVLIRLWRAGSEAVIPVAF